MKKIAFFFLILTPGIFFAQHAYAQEEEEKSTQEEIAEEAQDAIEKIKDAVASKVAELDLVEKRGIFGNVVEVATTEITIEDEFGNQRIIEIDELTRFEGERQSDDFGISDIEVDSTVSAVGLYNKDTERLLARFITQKINIPEQISGAIQGIDADEFTVTVIDRNGKEYLIDIETSTDTALYEAGEMDDSGFSQLEVGQRVIVTALPDANEEDRYAAERILHFAELPPADKVQEHLESPTKKAESPQTTPTEEE